MGRNAHDGHLTFLHHVCVWQTGVWSYNFMGIKHSQGMDYSLQVGNPKVRCLVLCCVVVCGMMRVAYACMLARHSTQLPPNITPQWPHARTTHSNPPTTNATRKQDFYAEAHRPAHFMSFATMDADSNLQAEADVEDMFS